MGFRKNKVKWKLVAYLLTFTMLLNMPMMGTFGQTYAAENTQLASEVNETPEEYNENTGEEETNEPITDGEEETNEPITDGEEETNEPITDGEEGTNEPITGGEEETNEPIADGEEETNEPIVDGEEESNEEMMESPTPSPSPEPSKDIEVTSDDSSYLKSFGTLSTVQVEEKLHIANMHKQVEKMSASSYIKNELIYWADSKKEAEIVAMGYGGTLKEYSDNIATIVCLREVEEVLEDAADMSINLPAVYPNLIYVVEEEEDLAIENAIESAISEEYTEDMDSNAFSLFSLKEENTYIPAAGVVEGGYNDPWLQSSPFQWHLDKVGVYDAWKNNIKGKDILVAVIDTGIDKNHPDLKKNIKEAVNKSTQGYEGATDHNGHGTHVAGIIAAQLGNGVLGAGIAPEAKILAIKALEEGPTRAYGSSADVIKSINYAVSKKARIINMSLGSSNPVTSWSVEDVLMQKAITAAVNKGCIVVAAAGNDAANLTASNLSFPASCDGVVTVAALNNNDGRSNFSNHGSNYVEIAAPGGEGNPSPQYIYSTVPGGGAGMAGTSQASPIVAGTLALIISANPSLKTMNATTAQTALDILYGNCDSSNAGVSKGKVNISKAMGDIPTIVACPTMEIVTPRKDAANKPYILSGDSVKLVLPEGYMPGTKIYYTLDGKKPTTSSASCDSGNSIVVTGNGKKTLKAIAVKSGVTSKTVLSVSLPMKAAVTGIAISSKNGNYAVEVGSSLTLQVAYTPDYTTNKIVEWSSSDEDIATVTNKGVVKPKAGIVFGDAPKQHKKVIITATTKDPLRDAQVSKTFEVNVQTLRCMRKDMNNLYEHNVLKYIRQLLKLR